FFTVAGSFAVSQFFKMLWDF
nr:hypothetical protein [Tanacetum cinerariifolium]